MGTKSRLKAAHLFLLVAMAFAPFWLQVVCALVLIFVACCEIGRLLGLVEWVYRDDRF